MTERQEWQSWVQTSIICIIVAPNNWSYVIWGVIGLCCLIQQLRATDSASESTK